MVYILLVKRIGDVVADCILFRVDVGNFILANNLELVIIIVVFTLLLELYDLDTAYVIFLVKSRNYSDESLFLSLCKENLLLADELDTSVICKVLVRRISKRSPLDSEFIDQLRP